MPRKAHRSPSFCSPHASLARVGMASVSLFYLFDYFSWSFVLDEFRARYSLIRVWIQRQSSHVEFTSFTSSKENNHSGNKIKLLNPKWHLPLDRFYYSCPVLFLQFLPYFISFHLIGFSPLLLLLQSTYNTPAPPPILRTPSKRSHMICSDFSPLFFCASLLPLPLFLLLAMLFSL